MQKQLILKKIQGLVKKFYLHDKKSMNVKKKKFYITVGWPIFDHREVNRLIGTLLDGKISMGPATKEFEKSFAHYLGIRHSFAVNSGTSANMLAFATLLDAGDLSAGDEVIVPASTFSTVASPIIQLGLIPVYVDVDPTTYNIDPKEVKKAISKKTKAIMIVHSLGHPANLPELLVIAKKNKLKIIEDCCEAHGASYKGKRVGSFGDLGTYSFYVAHNITTGEGGMVVTNNAHYATIIPSLREFGRITKPITPENRFTYYDDNLKYYDKKYVFERLGYNVRMTDLAASLGIEQLKKLDSLNKKRQAIVETLKRRLSHYEKFIQLPSELDAYYHTYYGFLIVIKNNAPFTRIEITTYLEKQGIETRPFFAGNLVSQPAFAKSPKRIVGNLPIASWLRDQAFFIGCHPAISAQELNYVTSAFDNFFKNRKAPQGSNPVEP